MKKLCMAVFLSVCLLITLSCSSTPSGTTPVGDLAKKETELLGQKVVVVGMAETKTALSSFQMFRVFKGGDSIWVAFPETESMPPQGLKVRVTGTLQKKKFTGIPTDQLYIEATTVDME
jgi:hypothetical protein